MATTQQVLTTLGTKPITAEELLEMDAKGMRGELIRGVFCETPPTGMLHGEVIVSLGSLLGNSVEPTNLGTLAIQAGIILGRDPDTVLAADVSYFSAATMPLDADIPGYAEALPDLVAEVVSFNDSFKEVVGKANMWLNAGVQLVWVIWPETQMVEIYRPGQPVVTLAEKDTLTAEDVLPQFNIPVSDIFSV